MLSFLFRRSGSALIDFAIAYFAKMLAQIESGVDLVQGEIDDKTARMADLHSETLTLANKQRQGKAFAARIRQLIG